MPRKSYPACMSNFSLCMCSLVELITPGHCCVLTKKLLPLRALTLYSQNVICMMKSETPASHGNWIPKAFLEIPNFMCPLQGLGLLGSLGQIPLFFDPHSLLGVYLGY